MEARKIARASTRTLLPLDTFAKICGIHPLHFNQVVLDQDDPSGTDAMASVTVCDEPYVQYAWQGADKIGREEIAIAIANAERTLTDWLGFSPIPDWIQGDRVKYPGGGFIINGGYGSIVLDRWNMAKVQASHGYVHTGGTEAKVVLDDTVLVTYEDRDGDTYPETAVIVASITSDVTRASEVAMYYPGHGGEDAWEIRPISVSLDLGLLLATITCRRELLVLESIQENFVARAVDGLDDTNFLDSVEVWRHYTDPSVQVTFMWPGLGCGCAEPGCDVCGSLVQSGCMRVYDSRLGLVTVSPGTWDAVASSFIVAVFNDCLPPERALLNYKAGWINPRLGPAMYADPAWERAITYMALSMLDRPLCGCNAVAAFTKYWSEDLSLSASSASGGTSYKQADGMLNNPLGATRAASYVWRMVQRDRLGTAAVGA